MVSIGEIGEIRTFIKIEITKIASDSSKFISVQALSKDLGISFADSDAAYHTIQARRKLSQNPPRADRNAWQTSPGTRTLTVKSAF